MAYSKTMGQASCRIPDRLDTALQNAADEVGLFRSDVIRRALIYYIRTNPHDLEAFSKRSSKASQNSEASQTLGGTYDPTQEG